MVRRICICILGWLLLGDASPSSAAEIDSQRVYGYLQRICEIGRRTSGSTGMIQQRKLITEHFEALGCTIQQQEFEMRHPIRRSRVPLVNLFARWRPEIQDRLLICCHYDTRPYPDRDFLNRRGVFVGANDGASGVAVMMELGHHLPELPAGLGIDFVFFDAEELVYDSRGTYFIGSTHFARTYKRRKAKMKYSAGVLLDMVGDRDLQIYREKNSMKYAREVTDEVWTVARRLGVQEFSDRTKHEIRDDHLPLNQIAGIPTTDVIDFDYPHWHTTSDIPANCSGQSLAKVARVVFGWLQVRGGSDPDVRIR